MNYIDAQGRPLVGKIVTHAFLVLVALVLVLGSWGTIGAGERGIRTQFSAVAGEVGTGIYFKIPLIQHVVAMDVQTQKEQVDGATAASSDLQTVSANVAVNYNVNGDKVIDLYQRVGEDYKSKIIDPAIQETLKSVTAKYSAEELITKRDTVTQDIQTLLASKLSSNDINVTAVSITDFNFSKTFNDAIEAKVTAEQNALAAKNKLDQVQYEAQQTVASAQAQAEAIKIQAQAINSQGGADYVELQRIKTWDGHGCTSYCGLQASTGLLVNGK